MHKQTLIYMTIKVTEISIGNDRITIDPEGFLHIKKPDGSVCVYQITPIFQTIHKNGQILNSTEITSNHKSFQTTKNLLLGMVGQIESIINKSSETLQNLEYFNLSIDRKKIFLAKDDTKIGKIKKTFWNKDISENFTTLIKEFDEKDSTYTNKTSQSYQDSSSQEIHPEEIENTILTELPKLVVSNETLLIEENLNTSDSSTNTTSLSPSRQSVNSIPRSLHLNLQEPPINQTSTLENSLIQPVPSTENLIPPTETTAMLPLSQNQLPQKQLLLANEPFNQPKIDPRRLLERTPAPLPNFENTITVPSGTPPLLLTNFAHHDSKPVPILESQQNNLNSPPHFEQAPINLAEENLSLSTNAPPKPQISLMDQILHYYGREVKTPIASSNHPNPALSIPITLPPAGKMPNNIKLAPSFLNQLFPWNQFLSPNKTTQKTTDSKTPIIQLNNPILDKIEHIKFNKLPSKKEIKNSSIPIDTTAIDKFIHPVEFKPFGTQELPILNQQPKTTGPLQTNYFDNVPKQPVEHIDTDFLNLPFGLRKPSPGTTEKVLRFSLTLVKKL